MRWDGMWCPCCGCKVRTRPRNSKFKEKLENTKKKYNTNRDKEQYPFLVYKRNDATANRSSLFVN
jgi:hypothetical protein